MARNLEKGFHCMASLFNCIALFFVLAKFNPASMAARHDPLSALVNSGRIILSVSRNIVADLVLMLVSSWFKLVDPKLFVIGPVRNYYFAFISLLTGVVFYLFARPASYENDDTSNRKQVGLAGILVLATGMIAPYAVGYVIHEKLPPWNSRFVLPALLGLALLISTVFDLLITSRRARHYFLAILIGLLAGFHNYNTLNFKSAWEKQESFYQQLIWRAPSIKPGTAIITNEEILGFMGDYPTSFGINTIYESKQLHNIPYWFFALSENFHFSADAILDEDLISISRATTSFTGKSSDALILSFEPENHQCLWVLRPEDKEYKYLPHEIQKAAQISNIQNIQPTETSHKFYDTIVSEDRDTWCYYYEKADLARQTKDWKKVAGYWEDALQRGYRPGSGFEYIVFIEAHAYLGKWKDALSLTIAANKITPAMYFILCPTWERLAQETPQSGLKDDQVKEAYGMLRCAP